MTLAIGRNLPAEKTHEMQVLASKITDDAPWDAELPKYTRAKANTGFFSPTVDNDEDLRVAAASVGGSDY